MQCIECEKQKIARPLELLKVVHEYSKVYNHQLMTHFYQCFVGHNLKIIDFIDQPKATI